MGWYNNVHTRPPRYFIYEMLLVKINKGVVMKVQFNDLQKQWRPIVKHIKRDIAQVIDNTSFIDHPSILQFENKLKKLHNRDNAIGCSSGTNALYLLLRGYDIGYGDEIIFPSNTFIATAFAISMTGATPIPCDVGMDGLINIDSIKERITKKTKAIIVVHLFGCAVELNDITKLALEKNLLVFEDSAQVIGNKYIALPEITCGSSISFYPGKNLGAFGQAGAVVLNNDNIAKKIRCVLNQGQVARNIHEYKGGNFRLDAIQAIPLNYGIDKIVKWNEHRQWAASIYNSLLPSELLMKYLPERSIYHIYPIILPSKIDRTETIKKLNDVGIASSIHYPIPVHKTGAYKELSHFECPNVEYLCDRMLSLPMFAAITEKQIKYVVKCLLKII
jgi:dTDP-4-amino-4,6-dideoxygalactose transaminase